MWDASPHWRFQPRPDTVDLVDTLFVRKIRLAEDVAIEEALESKRFAHTCFLVYAEENVGVLGFLSRLELEKNRKLEVSSCSLLLESGDAIGETSS